MKRPLTLTGAILATVGQGIYGILALLAFITYCEFGVLTYIIVALLITLVVLTALVMNIVSIGAWNKDKDGYKKLKGIIITAVVLNFVVVLNQLLDLFAAGVSVGIVVLYFLLIGLNVAGNVLMLVDLSKEGKRWGEDVTVATTTANAPSAAPKLEDKLQAADVFSQKLAKIDALKEKGILSEEEYSEIKKSYVKEYLEKQ
ncbi:MAG: hypothetical protein IJY90_02595 [Clostridia bacterium]|nr:hypothetical protein [Clostridia bacterium]